MQTYQVIYKADGRSHTVIVKAWSKSAARIKARQMALALGYTAVTIESIKIIN